jgi:hypothetical protein
MSLSAAVIDALVASGATAEQLAAAMKAALAEAEAKVMERRAKDAARQAKSRKNRKSQDVTVTPRDACDAPNDIYSNPENPSEAKASPPPSIETRLVEEWNAGPAANGARKAAKLDASRKTLLRARLRDHGEDEVFTALRNLGQSKFHCGENDRSWRANLGWFLEAKNFLKALEMAPPSQTGNAAPKLSPDEQRAYCESIARKFGRMSPDTASTGERSGKPITFGTIAAQISTTPQKDMAA